MTSHLSLLLILLVILGSCQDPASVDATRDKKVKFDPNDVPPNFLITPDIINIGVIRPNQIFEIDLTATNITDNPVTLLGATFPRLYGKATLSGLDFPLLLAKQFSTGYTKEFKLTFASSVSGFYRDTLVYPNHKNPKVSLTAMVAHVYADDLVFDDTQINQFSLKFLQIRNNSSVDASITEFELIDTDGAFINEPKISLPMTIQAESFSEDIKLTFNPMRTGLYKATIKFKVVFASDSDFYYYDTVEISGMGF